MDLSRNVSQTDAGPRANRPLSSSASTLALDFLDDAYPPIADYAVIGDCRTAALVSSAGSIEWLCLPDFEKPSVFAALLDRRRGGRFQIRPTERYRTTRRYLPGTPILETTFQTARGRARLIDLFPVSPERERARSLRPDRELLRWIEGLEGEVDLAGLYDPRLDYGRHVPRMRDGATLGWSCSHRGETITLLSDLPWRSRRDAPGLTGRWTVRAGQTRACSLTYAEGEPTIYAALGAAARERLLGSQTWWGDWAQRCRYQGPYREIVLRSALVLKLLCYAPTGGIVASLTSSLPEWPGGGRNWDYRYCWLRDASYSLSALLDLGYADEGRAFLDWLIEATGREQSRLHVVYDLYGNRRLGERRLDHLEGYRGSSPVRIGNEASRQLQLDIYGQVINAAHEYVARGGELEKAEVKLLMELGRYVMETWRLPDHGIWEPRSAPRHYTHSKVSCWVALDRLLQLRSAGVPGITPSGFGAERERIRAAIEEHGYDGKLGSYVSAFDSRSVDASLLLLPIHGYLSARGHRMRGTYDRIHEQLGHGSLLYRYDGQFPDGQHGPEGCFGIAGFWAVQVLVARGDLDEAQRRFEELLAYGSDLGLYAEEIAPDTGEALGNFPQGYTHVGLINAALRLEEARRGKRPPGRREEAP